MEKKTCRKREINRHITQLWNTHVNKSHSHTHIHNYSQVVIANDDAVLNSKNDMGIALFGYRMLWMAEQIDALSINMENAEIVISIQNFDFGLKFWDFFFIENSSNSNRYANAVDNVFKGIFSDQFSDRRRIWTQSFLMLSYRYTLSFSGFIRSHLFLSHIFFLYFSWKNTQRKTTVVTTTTTKKNWVKDFYFVTKILA